MVDARAAFPRPGVIRSAGSRRRFSRSSVGFGEWRVFAIDGGAVATLLGDSFHAGADVEERRVADRRRLRSAEHEAFGRFLDRR